MNGINDLGWKEYVLNSNNDLILDLLFSRKNNEGRIAAIESKFTEPFSGGCGSFQESYFKKRGLLEWPRSLSRTGREDQSRRRIRIPPRCPTTQTELPK